jgi:hypothetical protein
MEKTSTSGDRSRKFLIFQIVGKFWSYIKSYESLSSSPSSFISGVVNRLLILKSEYYDISSDLFYNSSAI